jgi:hypothetical protein
MQQTETVKNSKRRHHGAVVDFFTRKESFFSSFVDFVKRKRFLFFCRFCEEINDRSNGVSSSSSLLQFLFVAF